MTTPPPTQTTSEYESRSERERQKQRIAKGGPLNAVEAAKAATYRRHIQAAAKLGTVEWLPSVDLAELLGVGLELGLDRETILEDVKQLIVGMSRALPVAAAETSLADHRSFAEIDADVERAKAELAERMANLADPLAELAKERRARVAAESRLHIATVAKTTNRPVLSWVAEGWGRPASLPKKSAIAELVEHSENQQ